MATIREVIDQIEKFAPLDTQASYDNCGVKIGNIDMECTGVLITLDLTPECIQDAITKKCNFILEHHPSIWNGLKEIDTFFPKTQALLSAYTHSMTVYSAHTNVDFAQNGLNDYFAKQIFLTDINAEEEGRTGSLPQPMTLQDYAKKIGEILHDNSIKVIGNPEKIIKKVAAINGAGGGSEELIRIYSQKTDVFVTSEVKYNVARLSKDIDYAIIEVNHYTSEQGFMPLMHGYLTKVLPTLPVFENIIPNPYL